MKKFLRSGEGELGKLNKELLDILRANSDFLIAGKDAGSKLKKAESMNIDIKGIDFVDDLMNN